MLFSSFYILRVHAPHVDTVQCLAVSVNLLVRLHCLHVDHFTLNILNSSTASSLSDVTYEGPLAHTPVLDCTRFTLIPMAGHVSTSAPIRLARYSAKILPTACDWAEVDADVVGARVVILVNTISILDVTSESHVIMGAWFELCTNKILVNGGRGRFAIEEEK